MTGAAKRTQPQNISDTRETQAQKTKKTRKSTISRKHGQPPKQVTRRSAAGAQAGGKSPAQPPNITRVSGPVSVHVFDFPNEHSAGTNRLYMFGDEHFSYDHMCDACERSKGCATIMQFVDEQVSIANERHGTLDVFLEMPYVPSDGKIRDNVLTYFDRLFRSNAGPPSGALHQALLKMVGSTPFYIGQLAQLYKRYNRELYDDTYKRQDAQSTGVRFHYSDARREPNVDAILNDDAIKWPTAVMREVLHAFLFSSDFPADIRRALGTDRAVVHETLSSTGPTDKRRVVHKVAKQYHALRDGRLKGALRRYLEDRVEEVITVMRDVVGMDSPASSSSVNEWEQDPPYVWVSGLREWRTKLHTAAFKTALRFGAIMLIMDAYLLGRMLRFIGQRADTTGGTSIVYVGDAHADFYVRFFRDYIGLSASVCRPMRGYLDASSTSRCVAMTGSAHCHKPRGHAALSTSKRSAIKKDSSPNAEVTALADAATADMLGVSKIRLPAAIIRASSRS